jgi:hypothetical protein
MRYAQLAFALGVSALIVVSLVSAEEVVEGRRSVVLQGQDARLVVDILGGSIVSFQFNDQALNPLRWANDGPTDKPRQMSQFLCLDRWGPPSPAEAANGMPFHGEAGLVEWQVLDEKPTTARMRATLPLAGLDIDRTVWLAPEGSWFQVRETVSNKNKLGRIYNMVQHASIGPPFLDASVVVDSNAKRGFPRGGSMPNPEEPSALWPLAPRPDGTTADVRHLTTDSTPDVVSYVIDADIGWVTAANAAKGLLIGYVWRTDEYPWLNVWRRLDNGVPAARGLEFGTTGLHEPFPTLVKKGTIFDRRIYQYLDAAESQTRSYVGFLAKLPAGYQGVDDLVYKNGEVTLFERGGGSQIKLPMPASIRPANP